MYILSSVLFFSFFLPQSLLPFISLLYSFLSSLSPLSRLKCPMELENFRNMLLVDVQHADERLMNSWYSKVISLFSGDEKMVGNKQQEQSEAFYESVSTLIGNQIR